MLSVACTSDSIPEVVEFLLQRCPELARIPDSDGKLPLHTACEWGSINEIEPTYAAYPEAIKMFTNTGVLPLHYALANESSILSSEQKLHSVRFLLRHYPEAANLRDEHFDDSDGPIRDDDEYYFDEYERMRFTPYQMSRFVSGPEVQRILLRARPEADLQQYRKLNYEARRQLMFLAFAACTNPLSALSYSHSGVLGTETGHREKAAVRQKTRGAVAADAGEFVYHLRRLMNFGKEMGLLKHIASFL